MRILTGNRRHVESSTRLVLASLVVGVAAFSGAVVTAQVAAAATDTVTNCGDSGAGSLPDVVQNAASGDTVTFALSPSCNLITLSSSVDIDTDLTITGPGANVLAVSGGTTTGVFQVAAGVSTTIAGLTIENGSSTNGGGILNGGTLNLSQSTVSENTASGTGGGIDNNGGTLNITDSTVASNTASGDGGGIENNGGTLNVIDSTVVSNEGADGGGIDNDAGTATVTASTLEGNVSTSSGDGISNEGGTVSAAATILAYNDPDECAGSIVDAGYNIEDDGAATCGFSTADHSQPGVDPELVASLTNNGGPTPTEMPTLGSPVIAWIPPGVTGNGITLCSGTDQRGVPRPVTTNCDIGSVEMELAVATAGKPFFLTVQQTGSVNAEMSKTGKLPKHFTFTNDGYRATISGAAKKTGVYAFTVKATSGMGRGKRVVKQAFAITVNPA
jgi:hypothetical protein